MNRFKQIAVVAAMALFGLLAFGCHKESDAAKNKMLAALNPASEMVKNGRSAVLQGKDGYFFVIPFHAGATYEYVVYFSPDGKFHEPLDVIAKGTNAGPGNVTLTNLVFFLGNGDSFESVVQLDFKDYNTQIAGYSSLNPGLINIQKLKFHGNQKITAEDVSNYFK